MVLRLSSNYNLAWLIDAHKQLGWFVISIIAQRTKQDRQCTYNVTLRRVRATTVAVEKQQMLHKLSVCICSLCQPAREMPMRSIILSFVVCTAVLYFSTLSPKRLYFKKKIIAH